MCDYDTSVLFYVGKKHIPYLTNQHCCTTYLTASDRALLGCRQSRRDDMESIVWTLCFFDGCFVDEESQDDPKLTYKNRPKPERSQLKKMLNHIQRMKYKQKPKYNELIQILRS